LDTSIVDQLKKEWFERLDLILSRDSTIPSSNLKCLDLCEARCCPREGMRGMTSEKIASPVVVLLPFEMEYLLEKTGASPSVFRRWPIDVTPDVSIEIGILDLGKPCPFLRNNWMCGIHEHNPLDCRTFPLLPAQNVNGKLEWSLGENCPSLHLLNPRFSGHIKRVWRDLYPVLPQSWWDLYTFADHWTGWRIPVDAVDHAT
jgi:Fe-S-cluster containining protein